MFGADAAEIAAARRRASCGEASGTRSGRPRRPRRTLLSRDASDLAVRGGALIEGFVDLAYADEEGFVVVDFKTDRELEGALDRYQRQVSIYAAAIAAATGRSARAVLMRV